MASDKIQINRHVHFKKTLEDVREPREVVEDTDLRGGRKGDDKVIQVEVNGPIRIHVKSEATPNQVKKCPEQNVEKDAKVEKKSPRKPIEEEKKEIDVKIEIGKEKGANKIEEKIIEEKKDQNTTICINGLREKKMRMPSPTSGHGQRGHWYRLQEEFEGFEEFDGFFGYPNLVSRDLNDIFREFFGGADPFEEILYPFNLIGDLQGAHRQRRFGHRHRNRCHGYNPHDRVNEAFKLFEGEVISRFGAVRGYPALVGNRKSVIFRGNNNAVETREINESDISKCRAVKGPAKDGLQGVSSSCGTKNYGKEEKICCKNVNINVDM